MEAIEFVIRYQDYIEQLEKVVKPEYQPAIVKLKELDPQGDIGAHRLANIFSSKITNQMRSENNIIQSHL